MSERRRDRLTGDTVIVATERSERPHAPDADDSAHDCPFCPGHEDQTPPSVLELTLQPGPPGWYVRVFPNRYPIVDQPEAGVSHDEGFASRAVWGIHEVVVETPMHDHEMAQRTPEELALTLAAYRARLSVLLAMPGIRHVALFKNQGADAGNSLAHPHSQIVALSYAPRGVTHTVRAWRRYHAQTGICLLCAELARELKAKTRVIEADADFLLYAPFAATRPAEMVLAPLRHQAGFAETSDDDLRRLSSILLSALRRLHAAFDDPPYNLVLQTWPEGAGHNGALHWYLRIVPRQGVLGGFELSTGDFVSTMTAGQAAAAYRAHGAKRSNGT